MANLPYFQFYPGDWVQDTAALSLAAKGAWTDILCALWRSQTRGSLTLPALGWARVIRASVDQAEQVINELVSMKTCDSVTQPNGEITIINRRQVREEKERNSNTERQRKYRERCGNAESNGNVTPISSVSSSFSTLKKDRSNGDELFHEEQARLIKAEIAKIMGWGLLSDAVTAEYKRLVLRVEKAIKKNKVENPFAYALTAARNLKNGGEK